MASVLTALAFPFAAGAAGHMRFCEGSLHAVVEGASSMQQGMRVERTEGAIVFKDPADPRFFAYAEVSPLDELTISLFTRDGATGERSKVLHGRQIFDTIMSYFKDEFKVFKAHWTPLTDGTLSDNLHEFRAQLAGHSPAEAAELTWSGRQAVRHGLRAQLVDQRPDGSVTVLFAPAH